MSDPGMSKRSTYGNHGIPFRALLVLILIAAVVVAALKFSGVLGGSGPSSLAEAQSRYSTAASSMCLASQLPRSNKEQSVARVKALVDAKVELLQAWRDYVEAYAGTEDHRGTHTPADNAR